MGTAEAGFWEAVDDIRSRDGRFRREAYGFVMAALGAVVQTLPDERRLNAAKRHLSGQELLQGVIRLARQEFGAIAPVVFREWGIATGEDVGHIVFQLVESRQLSARSEDSIEDFRGTADLFGALTADLDLGPRRRTHERTDLSRREPGTKG